MSSHRAIPACTVPKAPKTTGTTSVRQCHMRLISTRKLLYYANFSTCFFPMLPSPGQLISIRRQVFVFLFLRQMSERLALIFLAVVMMVSHIIVMSSVSTNLSGRCRYHLLSTGTPKWRQTSQLMMEATYCVDQCSPSVPKHYSMPQCGRLFPGLHCHAASRTDITM